MHRCRRLAVVLFLAALAPVSACVFANAPAGLVVVIGCDDAASIEELAGDGAVVQAFDVDPAKVNRAREYFAEKGLYGKVAVDAFDGRHLPLTDGLVNTLIVRDTYDIPSEEAKRVLAPLGECRIGDEGGTTIRKPWPEAIDEWTHYLHGPGNNAVANDTMVGPPRNMQWLAEPLWTRTHHKLCSVSAVVTAGGRLFYIVDTGPAANYNVPPTWRVVARDAFSGVTLWTHDIDSWAEHTIRFRSGPAQVTRLLVATDDRVYAPLGLSSPVSVLDAATGETVETYDDTTGAEEMILCGDTLFVLCGDPVAEQAVKHAAFQGLVKGPTKKVLIAVDTKSGKTLWRWTMDGDIRPETLAADEQHAYVQVDESVAAINRETGESAWTYKAADAKDARKLTWGQYTLVAAEDVVLCKLADQLVALSADDGAKLWETGAGKGFHSPFDVFVIDGVVWTGSHPDDSISPPPVDDFSVGLDLHTGEIVSRNTVAVDMQTVGHHHRCYREKATVRFIMMGKRGIELMDVEGDEHSRNNWIRGACQYGILPANGLTYAPPHACGCYMESKLVGFWALAAERETGYHEQFAVDADDRLTKGPAYGQPIDATSSSSEWSTHRGNALRSGVTTTSVAADLDAAWTTKLGGRLTQPVVAGGKVLVASTDEHAVYAMDEATGEVAWKFTAGGRIDSTPTIDAGRVLFGSADGRVYCLRLADGALIWSYFAAPADVRTIAIDQVESLWPVHGSVLVLDGVAYASAGRSTWLDGGIHLHGLDPATGRVMHHRVLESRHPVHNENKALDSEDLVRRIDQNKTDYKTLLDPDLSDAFSMAGGAVSDVLVSDGENVFLHHAKLSPELEPREDLTRHLFSTSSLLDPHENHRSHWVLGTGDFSRVPVAYSWVANNPAGKRQPTIAVPAGVMLVFDDDALWGIRRLGDSSGKYHLFKKPNEAFDPDEAPSPDFQELTPEQRTPYLFDEDWTMRTTAMLKAGDRLFVGGAAMDLLMLAPSAGYDGDVEGVLRVASAEDGSIVAEYELPAPPVWDGMSAADGKLFVSTEDGAVRCLGSEK